MNHTAKLFSEAPRHDTELCSKSTDMEPSRTQKHEALACQALLHPPSWSVSHQNRIGLQGNATPAESMHQEPRGSHNYKGPRASSSLTVKKEHCGLLLSVVKKYVLQFLVELLRLLKKLLLLCFSAHPRYNSPTVAHASSYFSPVIDWNNAGPYDAIVSDPKIYTDIPAIQTLQPGRE